MKFFKWRKDEAGGWYLVPRLAARVEAPWPWARHMVHLTRYGDWAYIPLGNGHKLPRNFAFGERRRGRALPLPSLRTYLRFVKLCDAKRFAEEQQKIQAVTDKLDKIA